MKKSGFGIEISKSKDKPKKEDHLLAYLALAYHRGAVFQLNRYLVTVMKMKEKKIDPLLGTLDCLHESSSLFENLFSIYKHLDNMEINHSDHETWEDFRHHIRHDFREQFNKPDGRTSKRAIKLEIKEGMITTIQFDPEFIKVGSKIIKIKKVSDYLEWSGSEIDKVIRKALKDGLISFD